MKTLVILLVSLLLSLSHIAGTIVVQNTNDSGVGSLRQATIDAIDGDTIRFNPNLIANGNDTIKLSSEISLNKGLVIKGLYNGIDSLFISGQDSVRIFELYDYNLTLTIDSMVLIKGNAFQGGAISFRDGDSLLIFNSVFKDSYASEGGGVYFNAKYLRIVNSNIYNNHAVYKGGGLYYRAVSNYIGEVKSSSIRNNSSSDLGGGIYCSSKLLIDETVIENNSSINSGGGISAGSVTLTNSTVSKNESLKYGGGISSVGNLTIVNCILSDNNATEHGSGIYKSTGVLLIDSSEISNNYGARFGGAGIYSNGSTFQISNSTIRENESDGNAGGGGAYFVTASNISSGPYIIEKSNFENNISSNKGGGVYMQYLYHTISIKECYFYNNKARYGAGVYNYSSSISVEESTFYENKATHNGGAINSSKNINSSNNYTTEIRTSTFNKNTAAFGAGIFSSIPLSILNSTITGNSSILGGGIYSTLPSVQTRSSIVALNGSHDLFTDFPPNINSGGNNIFGDPPSGVINTDIINQNATSLRLLPLAFNGGLTKTMLPDAGSISIDRGTPTDSSVAQNDTLYGFRDVGAAESCYSAIFDTVVTCSSYIFAGNSYDSSGIYFDSLTNINGCDSIITLTLTITNARDTFPTIIICEGDSALIFNNYKRMSGTFYDSIITSNGCGGLVVRVQNLVVNPIFIDTLPSIVICTNDSALLFGNYEVLPGFYYDSLTTINGCDSITIQELQVNQSFIDTLNTITICSGDSTIIFGVYESTPGIYYDSLSTINGCDSLITKALIINSIYNDTLTPLITCADDSILIFGVFQKNTGFYYDSLITLNGCDSVIIQELRHNLEYNETLNPIRVCMNDSALVFGVYESTSGIYYDSLTTVNGCDSIVIQELVVPSSYLDTLLDLTICNDDSILVFGNYEKTAGFYYDSLTTVNGCDSVIVQKLIINQRYEINSTPIISCDSAFINGNWYYTSQVIVDSLSSFVTGCDSIITTGLIIHESIDNYLPDIIGCDSIEYMGNIFYSDTIIKSYFPGGAFDGCDSSSIQKLIIENLDHTTSKSELTLISNQNWALYQWIDCSNGNVEILGETNQSYTVSSNGDYAVVVTTVNCSDTSDCISVYDVGLPEIKNELEVSIYPNPNRGVFTLDCQECINSIFEVTIFNLTGEKVMQIKLNDQLELIDMSGFEKGVYFVKVENEKITKVIKIIKQ